MPGNMGNYELDEHGLPRRIKFQEKEARKADEERLAKVEKEVKSRQKKRAGGDTKQPARAKHSKKTILDDDANGEEIAVYHEKLPHGGTITLQNPDEVAYFRQLMKRYMAEYKSLLAKPNDVNRLSQLISFELVAHRNTQRMMGAVNRYDKEGNIIGVEKIDPVEMANISQTLPKIQDEIRRLESALKIDKRTREGSGEGDIRSYMETLKRAAINYKVHLSKRYMSYDEFVNELRWRMRVWNETDQEDKAYHGLDTPEKVFAWIDEQLQELEAVDKEFATNKQSIWVGKI